MARVTSKEYYCPVCGNSETHSTNHYGEIYCECRVCMNNVLYCSEGDLGEPEGECRVQFYRFNLEYEEDKEQYKELCKFLKETGYKKFDTSISHRALEELSKRDGKAINLYRVNAFERQFISDIGRLHEWFEAIFPNKKLKAGYFLVEA